VGLSFAFPPYDVLPALVAYSALLVIMEAGEAVAERRWLERALLGAAFGFGAHLMGLWWVGAAFLVEADRYAVFLPFAVLGLPLLLSPFMALATLLAGLAPPGFAWRAIGLALSVSFAEWLRGIVLTGFPWNAAGIGVTQFALLSQSAAAVGVNGLAVAAVLLGALPAALAEARSRWLAVPAGAVLAAMATFGAVRLLTLPPPADAAPLVRVVQPAVPQHMKWDPDHTAAIWQRLLALTAGAPGEAGDPPSVVVWPETAIPFRYRASGAAQMALAEALAPDTVLVTGAAEIDVTGEGRRTFNTVLVIGPDGSRLARYDKSHLVPFGEYVPLSDLLGRVGIDALAAGPAAFAAGPGPRTLHAPGLPAFEPLICYEVIFPHRAAGPSAAWIVNVTNDAWFGDTPGPRQHLRHAQLRAIERGLPVVRAANTGISAVIDSAGRPVIRLGLGREGAIEARLPAAHTAPYAALGDRPLYALWIGGVAGVALRRRRGARREAPRRLVADDPQTCT